MTRNEELNYDLMISLGIATSEELNLAFNLLGGNWTDTINKVCYVRTGYPSFDLYFMTEVLEDED